MAYMSKTKAKKRTNSEESDGLFVLKLILLIFLGSIWLRVGVNGSEWGVPIPLGFLIGIILVQHEHFQIDRKIEYAALVGSVLVSFFLPFGLVLSL
jgi:hypothetical protein